MSLALRRLDSSEPGFAEALTRLLAYADDVDAEVEEIMQISARLVVNRAALKLKREPIRNIIDSFANAIGS